MGEASAGVAPPRMARRELFDAHCHLQLPRLLSVADDVVAQAQRSGVARAAVCACGREDWPAVADLAERHPGFVAPQFGVHPWWAGEHEACGSAAWARELEERLLRSPAAGVGECGLDGARKKVTPMEVQLAVLEPQLAIAARLARPLSLHCVRAHGVLLEALQRRFGRSGHAPGLVLHSYCGDAAMVPPFLRLNCYFSFSASALHVPKHAAALRAVPLDRLLLETDSPDQLPRTLAADPRVPPEWGVSLPAAREDAEGRMNEPAMLRGICEGLCGLLGLPAAELASITADNARRVFDFLGPAQGGSPSPENHTQCGGDL